MPRIRYLPDERDVEVKSQETILEASLRSGIPHAHACGGHGRCSTCRVTVVEGVAHCAPPNKLERDLARRLHFCPQIRLGCQMTIRGDVTLRRMILDAEDARIVRDTNALQGPVSIGEEKRIAILFADIRNFTPFAESFPPYDVIYVLNRYFHEMGKVITKHGGTIDNYMGDGLVALFGIDKSGNAALKAVKAGLAMLHAAARMRPLFEDLYRMRFRIGIGVHYGEAVVGSIGAEHSKRLTAIGDAVNLASRIEAANKDLGTQFLISDETRKAVRSAISMRRRHAGIQLKGMRKSYTLYEVGGPVSRKSRARRI